MLNHIIIVGKVKEAPVIKETSSGLKYCYVLVDVVRPFKNSEGGYDVDTLNCTMWRNLAENSLMYCKVGAIVGIKGRLQSSMYTKDNGNTFYNYDVVVEKVTFISSPKEDA